MQTAQVVPGSTGADSTSNRIQGVPPQSCKFRSRKLCRERNSREKGYSAGYIKLPCDRLVCEVELLYLLSRRLYYLHGRFWHKCPQVCEIEGFASEFAVMAHVRKIHGPREQLSCEEEGCDGKTFKNIGALIYHKQKCHTEKAPCAVCGATDYSILKNHMVSKHPKPCEPETCDQCGKVFTNKASFKSHMKNGHASMANMGKAKLLSDFDKNCQCSLNLPTNISKINHYKLFHLDYEQCEKCEKIVQSISDGHHKCSKPVKKPLAAPLVCNYCGKEFNSDGGMSYHVKTVHLKVSCHISETVSASSNQNINRKLQSAQYASKRIPSTVLQVKVGPNISQITSYIMTFFQATWQSINPRLHATSVVNWFQECETMWSRCTRRTVR